MANEDSVKYISKYTAQKRISILWFLGSLVAITIFYILIVTGDQFNNKEDDAWKWLLQQIVPSLTLIIGAFIADRNADNKKSKLFNYRLSFFLSLFYFIFLLATILNINSVDFTSQTRYQYLESSSTFLIPILGLVSLSLGMFFAKAE